MKIIHYHDYLDPFSILKSLCGRFRGYSRPRAARVAFYERTTTDVKQVTCKICKKILRDG